MGTVAAISVAALSTQQYEVTGLSLSPRNCSVPPGMLVYDGTALLGPAGNEYGVGFRFVLLIAFPPHLEVSNLITSVATKLAAMKLVERKFRLLC